MQLLFTTLIRIGKIQVSYLVRSTNFWHFPYTMTCKKKRYKNAKETKNDPVGLHLTRIVSSAVSIFTP